MSSVEKKLKTQAKVPKIKKTTIAEVLTIKEYAKQELNSYALPEVCNRVRSMIDSEDATMDDISKVVVIDPSITLSIMKLANSPIYSLKDKVDSLSRALTVLGGERIYSMILSEFTMTTFRDLHCKFLDMERFWTYSFCTAFIAQELARKDGMTIKEQEKLYICGLLHNIGELSVAKRSPKTAVLIEKLMSEGNHPWRSQKAQLGFYYAECSAEMMRDWGMPDSLYELVGKIPSEEPSLQGEMVKILAISAQCALETVSSEYFNANDLIKEQFESMPNHELDMISTVKRNAIDRSENIVNLMDSFEYKCIP